MSEMDVTLTDYGLAVECVVFAFALARTKSDQIALRLAAGGFFLFLGLSAAIGGTVHGFCSSAGSAGCDLLWILTLLTAGCASASLWIAGVLLLSGKAATVLALLAAPSLVIYSGVVLLVTQQFWIAFTVYLPAMLMLVVGFLAGRTPLPSTARFLGVGGVVISLVSCLVQYLKIGLHPVYLSHNALAHVIQGIAMGFLFVALRYAVSRPHIA